MLRSVTTLKELAEMSWASTRLARTLPVMKVSVDRWLSVEEEHHGQIVDDRAHVFHLRHHLLHRLAVLGRGDFTGQQCLAVVAGHIDVGPVAQGLADSIGSAQLDAFVFDLGAGRAAVYRHHAADHGAAHDQGCAGR